MLSLKKLTFNNIGRFTTEQSIDFTGFDKLVQVNGFNKNTGGSSGAAKSTIFHAHDYLLGINDVPATGLQSRLVKAGMYVEAEYDVDGTKLTIKRSKKDGLKVIYGDETVSGNVKLAEERLWEIIGIPKKLFKKMVHKKQKEGGFFLNLTAKESYEFLMNALGLEKISEKTFIINEDIKEINNRITQLGHAISAFEQSIEEIEELKEFEKEPTCDIKQEDIDKIQSEIDTLKASIVKEETERDVKIKELEAQKPIKPAVVILDDQEVMELQDLLDTKNLECSNLNLEIIQKKTKINEAADDIKNQLAQIPHAQQKITTKAEQMKNIVAQKQHLEEQKCPTCMQQWVGDSAASKIQEYTDSLIKLKEEVLQNKAIVDGKADLETNLERVSKIIQDLEVNTELDTLNSEINTIKEKIIGLKANKQAEASKIENEYLKKLNIHNETIRATKYEYDRTIAPKKEFGHTLANDLSTKKQSLEYFNASLQNYKIKIDKYKDTLTEKKKNLKEAVQQREDKTKELAVAEESKRLIKTYTLQIFQDTLDYIGDYATEILSDIPNMSNATIYFEGCKENRSGSIKDEVNAIINIDGYDNINIKTLSGGERTAIDLAVDLAVIDMIESKAGKGADFFILDEPFDGLEDINIAQCLEVLRQVDTNKKIIIVDHNPIAKEMITDNILVERDGEQSVVL